MNGDNHILANCISLFHLLVIVFVLLAPFSETPYIQILHVTLCITLFVHWAFNNDTCALSIIESKLRGLDYNDSYSYKFIAPLYNISETDWSKIVWIITGVAMTISLYKLYHSEKLKQAWECYQSNQNLIECIRVVMT
jgi:hypothetical protein